MRLRGTLLALTALLAASAARAVVLPTDFVAENATPGQSFTVPTAFCFTPTGRVLVTEKRGRVYAVSNGIKSAPLIDLSAWVLDSADRGLLAIAVDPGFATNRWLYLYYTVDPDSDGVDDEHDAFGRLVRYQLSASDSNAIDPATRQVLIGATWSTGVPSCSDSHAGAAIRFGADGSLLLTVGEGSEYVNADGGGSNPQSFLPGRIDPAQDIGAYRAQDINSLGGKLLRIDPATGHGYASNPFFDGDPASVRSRVWCYGLRNPFRFCRRPGTGAGDPAAGQPGTFYIGDVGWVTWEDLNVARAGGRNFGWPCFEGFFANSLYRNLAQPPLYGCGTEGTASNPAVNTPPLLSIHHVDPTQSSVPGVTGNSITGGAFYTATRYPQGYWQGYFFGDYGQNWIKVAVVDANDQLVSLQPFATQADGPVDFASEPASGDLFYLAITAGELRHVRYTGPQPNRPPVVRAAATPVAGVKPLAVNFSVASSSDPDGDTPAFTWLFGDGAGASGATAGHTYTLPGRYAAIVTADDGNGGIGRDTAIVFATASATYPTTAVLDDFARADGPLGAAWTGAPGALAITGGAVAPAAGTPLALWNTPFGPEQEAFALLPVVDAAASPELIVKAQGPGATDARARVRFEPALSRLTVSTFAADSGWIDRAQANGIVFAGGQRFGVRAFSNGALSVYRDGASVFSTTLAGWPWAGAGGRIGFSLAGSGPARLDDFGGGDAVIDPNHPPVVTITSPADSSFYAVGDVLALRGTVTDVEDPAGSLAWKWTINLHHNNHVHPEIFTTAVHAPDYAPANHDDGTGVWLEIVLTGTDTGARVGADTVFAFPEIDLSPAVPTVRPDTIGDSGPAEYSFRLRNFGRMPAPFSHWQLTAAGVTIAQGDTLVPARDSVTVTVRANAALAAGTFTLRVTADTLRAVRETNEANNAALRPLLVVHGPTRDVLAPLFSGPPTIAPGGVDAWLRWWTDEPSRATARYGTTPALAESLLFAPFALDHDLRLAGLAPSTRYYLRVTARDTAFNATIAPLDSFTTRAGTADVPPPTDFALSRAWPNPASGDVALTLELPEARNVRVTVYDIAGREVWRQPEHELGAGRHVLIWRPSVPRKNPAGLYLVRVAAGERNWTRAVIRMP